MIARDQLLSVAQAEAIGYAVEQLAQSFSELAPDHLFTGAQAAEMLRLLSSNLARESLNRQSPSRMNFADLICAMVGHRYRLQPVDRSKAGAENRIEFFVPRICARCGNLERLTAAERQKIRAMVWRIMAGPH